MQNGEHDYSSAADGVDLTRWAAGSAGAGGASVSWLFSAADAAAAAAVVFAHKVSSAVSCKRINKLFCLRTPHNVCSMNPHTNETINQ